MLLIDGFVLTGGASQRMGRDKAGLAIGGATLAERAASAVRSISRSVHLAGNVSFAAIPTVPDVASSKNKPAAIYGVHSALRHSAAEWTAVLACDLPFVSAAFFGLLVRIAEIEEVSIDSIVPVQPDGRYQPLAALYRRDPCLAAIEEMLKADNRRLQDLFTRVRTRRVLPAEYASLDRFGRLFFNVNTPEDYDHAARTADDTFFFH